MTIKINIEEFCQDAKKHVDCVNRRLENCTEVQEYGPALGRLTCSSRSNSLFIHASMHRLSFDTRRGALTSRLFLIKLSTSAGILLIDGFFSFLLETLKLTFRVYLTQATTHGCHGLHDQIRIPRRLPRTRPSTTRRPRRRKSKKRRTTFSIEYHCRKKLLIDSCGLWNHSFAVLNRHLCHEAFQYFQCLSPLKMKCQILFAQDEHIAQTQAFLQICYKTFTKSSKNHIDGLTSSLIYTSLSLVSCVIARHGLNSFLEPLTSFVRL